MSLTSSSSLLITASLFCSTCFSICRIFFWVSSCIFCAKSSFDPAYVCCFSWNCTSLCLRYSSISFAASSLASFRRWFFPEKVVDKKNVSYQLHHAIHTPSLHAHSCTHVYIAICFDLHYIQPFRLDSVRLLAYTLSLSHTHKEFAFVCKIGVNRKAPIDRYMFEPIERARQLLFEQHEIGSEGHTQTTKEPSQVC